MRESNCSASCIGSEELEESTFLDKGTGSKEPNGLGSYIGTAGDSETISPYVAIERASNLPLTIISRVAYCNVVRLCDDSTINRHPAHLCAHVDCKVDLATSISNNGWD